jgi:hypothetical protein
MLALKVTSLACMLLLLISSLDPTSCTYNDTFDLIFAVEYLRHGHRAPVTHDPYYQALDKDSPIASLTKMGKA